MEKLYYDINKSNEDLAAINRNDILLTYEAEFDEFLTEETVWSKDSSYFIHNNFLYFSKIKIKEKYYIFKLEYENLLKDKNRNEKEKKRIKKSLTAFELSNTDEFLEKYDSPLIEIENLLKEEFKSFPNLIVETPHFYQCTCDIKKQINIDDVDKELLEKIKNSFMFDINPFLYDLNNHLYESINGNIYCLKPLFYRKNTDFKYGFYMNSERSSKYPTNVCVFFCFEKLSLKERNMIISNYILKDFYDSYDNPSNKRDLIFVEF